MSSALSILTDLSVMVKNEIAKYVPTLKWATVTAVRPLRIRFDGEDTALSTSPDALVSSLAVGERVFCIQINVTRRVVILGKARGETTPYRAISGNGASVAFWRGLNEGTYWNSNWSVSSMPDAYGFIEVYRQNSDVAVTYRAQPSGRLYRLAVTASTTDAQLRWISDEAVMPEQFGTVSFNSYIATGVYPFLEDSQMALNGQTPCAYAGILRVISPENRKNLATGSFGFVWQEFTVRQGAPNGFAGVQFTRQFYNGTWSAWERQDTKGYTGVLTLERIVLNGGTDVPSDTTHIRVEGNDGHLQIDQNEVQCYNADNSFRSFHLQPEGGNVSIGPGGFTSAGESKVTGKFSVTEEVSVTGPIVTNLALGGNGNGEVHYRRNARTDGTAHLTLGTDTNGEYLRSKTVYERTNTGTINMHVTSAGTFYRTTSRRDAKDAIEDGSQTWADGVLNLRPRTWFDRGNAETLADLLKRQSEGEEINWEDEDIPVLRRITGFVAEEVEEAGLSEFVTYDDDGEINGLAYDRIPAALVMLAQRQQGQIDTLIETVKSQQIEIDRLAGKVSRGLMDPSRKPKRQARLGVADRKEVINDEESPETPVAEGA